jgi:phospholipase C
MRPRLRKRTALAVPAALLGLMASFGLRAAPGLTEGSPVQHIVIVFQENHSFDDVLGYLCVQDVRCDGATQGQTHNGQTIPLAQAPDIVSVQGHGRSAQQKAINNGLMNGFSKMPLCNPHTGFACYVQYHPEQIPNLSALARQFVIADRVFEDDVIPTWGAHLDLVAAQLDGFVGNNPSSKGDPNLGWGCDAQKVVGWKAAPSDPAVAVPSCVPNKDGSGGFRETPVAWVPTIMDRLDEAGISWKIYAPLTGQGYGRATCPTFAECLDGVQHDNLVQPTQFLTDAAAGTLPAVSIVIPLPQDSQHNDWSMTQGDNWIGSVADSLMNGPDWGASAMFITWDDCGCFYDHVPPPPNLGIRVPMVIVSPFAKPAYTDSTTAAMASMMTYIEHTFALAPLWVTDRDAYDYANAFDYTQKPLAPLHLSPRPVPPSSVKWIEAHPPAPDPT